MKYILTFENFTPLSQGAKIETEYENGGSLMDKDLDKEITAEEKEKLEETEKEIIKRIKAKKKTSLNK